MNFSGNAAVKLLLHLTFIIHSASFKNSVFFFIAHNYVFYYSYMWFYHYIGGAVVEGATQEFCPFLYANMIKMQ